MSTPHNSANVGDIADRILLPGDPMRAKYIAETFLEDAICYNEIRGMLGFTGMYKGKRISVQGTGMGMPSMHIYANELMQMYGVKRLIRVGTCGSLREEVHLRDIIIALGATTDSNMNRDRFGDISFAPTASFELLQKAYEEATEKHIKAIVSNIFTSDKFYDDRAREKNKLVASYGVSAVDMETCELYTLASKYGADALTMLTVSDDLINGGCCSAEERQSAFCDMIRIALEIV